MRRAAALVLAGARDERDAICAATGLDHKALVHLAGTAMIVRVIDSLFETGRFERIYVCAAHPGLFMALPEIARRAACGEIEFLPTGNSPSVSVKMAVQHLGDEWPLLVTTSDHALLRPEMVDHLFEHADPKMDVVAAVVAADLIRSAYPDSRRTYLRFRGDEFSGANLFLLASSRAVGVLDFWQTIERQRKNPLRLVGTLGGLTLLRFVLGLLPLRAALHRLSVRTGATLGVVHIPFAEAAIDVDTPEDLDTVRAILTTEQIPDGAEPDHRRL